MTGKREFTRLRRALAKDLDRELRTHARTKGWKSAMGNAFAERNGWFVVAVPMVSTVRESTALKVLGKPMALDPQVWAMAGYPDLVRQPLSYRYNGVLAAMPITLVQAELDESGGAAGLAAQVLATAAAAAEGIAGEGMETYLTRLDQDGFGLNRAASRAAATVLAGRLEEARALLGAPTETGVTARPLRPGGSFAANAAPWLDAAIAQARG